MPCYVRIRKKRSVKKILFSIALVIAAITVGVSLFVKFNIDPVILAFCKEKVSKITNDAMNEASLEVILENASEDTQLIKVEYDTAGNIVLIRADAKNISATSARLALKAKEKLESESSTGIDIPYGSLSGLTFLTGVGPNLNVKVYSVSTVKSDIKSQFISKGINQTLHRIYLTVTTTVTIAVPGMRSNISSDNDVLMSECVIVGKIPDTYLNSDNVSDMLNLIK